MKMNRLNLIFYLIIIGQIAFGQVSELSPDVKSPNVTSLGMFGEIPVSLFTGTPDISIPLIDLKGKDLTLPLVLRYHPGGIKPNQRAGWIGVGWNIPTGTIYREVRGLPDEMDCDPFPQTGYYYRRNLEGNDWYLLGEAPNLSGNDRIIHHRNMSYYTDLEADIFHFNVMGIQGKFFLDESGHWKVQSDQFVSVELDPTTPFIDPLTKHSFDSPNLVSKSFNKFILKDGYGNRYVFGGVDATEYTSTINVGMRYIGNTEQEASGLTLQASSWSIVEIQSANQIDKIDFIYQRGPFVTNLYKYATYNQTYKNNNCQSFVNQNWLTGGGLVFPVYLKEITLNNQKIVFNLSKSSEINYAQTDYYGINTIDQDFLSAMDNVINSSWQYVPYYADQPFTGTYYDKIVWMKLDSIDHYVDNVRYRSVGLEYNDNAAERLFLQTLTHIGKAPNQSYDFSFVYHQKEQMPGYLKNLTDHWGFDNGILFSSSFSPSNIFSQRQPNASFSMNGILKEITYPTGGKTVFEFQGGDHSQIVSKNDRKSLLTESGVGGIRISKIQTYDENSDLALKKEYIYKKNGVNEGTVSSGILNNKPLYHIGTTSGTDMSGGSFSFSSFKSSSVDDLTDQAGILIGYSEVVEVSSAEDSLYYRTEVFTNHDNGYTDDNAVYSYNADLLSNKPVNSRAFERGRPLRTAYYNEAKEKVRSVSQSYHAGDTASNSSRSLMFNYMDVAVGCNVEYYYPSSVSYLNYFHTFTLSSIIDSSFTESEPIRSIEAYEYNPTHKLLTKKTSSKSNGDTSVNNYSYTYSFPSGVSDSYSVYDKMISKGMLHYPIEQTLEENGSVVFAQVNEYGMFGDIPKQSSTYLLETSSPLTSYQNAVFTPSMGPEGILQKDSRINLRETVPQYDSYGNPLEINMSGNIDKSLIWGYDGQFLIAQVQNASQSDIAYADFETDSKGNWSYTGSTMVHDTAPTGQRAYNLSGGSISKLGLDDTQVYTLTYWARSPSSPIVLGSTGAVVSTPAAIRAHKGWTYFSCHVEGTISVRLEGTVLVDDVRLHPLEAEMETYTYDLPVGMTSRTDASGGSLYFEYDGFQRLSAVRDMDGNLLETYCYNYAGQQVDCFTYEAKLLLWNDEISDMFTRNNCLPGYTPGPAVEYVVPANTYSSPFSKQEANDRAEYDLNTNGQSYANTVCKCYRPVYVHFYYSNYSHVLLDGDADQQLLLYKADLVVNFYADAAKTTPVNVSGTEMEILLHIDSRADLSPPLPTPYPVSASGTWQTLLQEVPVMEEFSQRDPVTGQFHVVNTDHYNHYLMANPRYIVVP